MINESGPKDFNREAREFVGRAGIPGDLANNHGGRRGFLRHPRTWPEVTPLNSYEEYMRNAKFDWNPAVAEAVIAASDQQLVKEYNQLIARINDQIGTGVSNQEQADRVADLFGEIEKFMRSKVYRR